MASLNKLAIRGIRSFDDKDVQIIQFFSPVTVVVGHNGSGKTTIIECLKYAATGKQPPNTNGGAFVHDPKLANENEVKAQVKLQFTAANNSVMEATRNLKITAGGVDALKSNFTSLEGILSTKGAEGTGKRATISTRCAEMNVEIPQLFGVSQAVLDNVIFCHQEDSCWPLAESSVLKKKFDGIFEATKYTKALDAIRSLRDKKAQELRIEKEQLDSLRLEKTRSDGLKARFSELTRSIAAKSHEYKEAEKKHALKVASNQEFCESFTKSREICVKVDGLTATKRRYEEELGNLKGSLQELAGSDRELQDRLNSFKAHVFEQERKRAARLDDIQNLKSELDRTRTIRDGKLNEHGELVAQAKAHDIVLEKREQLIKDLAAKYSMRGFESTPLDEERILDFIMRIEDTQRRLHTESADFQSKQKCLSAEYNTRFTQLRSERESYRGRKKDPQDRSEILRKQISAKLRDFSDLESATSENATVEADIEKAQHSIDHAKEIIREAKFDERMNKKTAEREERAAHHGTLQAELASVVKQSSEQGELKFKREQQQRKEFELKKALEASNPLFQRFIGSDAVPGTMERELSRVSIEKDAKLSTLIDAARAASQDVQTIDTALMSLRAQIKEKSEEIAGLDMQIKDDMDAVVSLLNIPDPYKALSEAEKATASARNEIASAKGGGPKLQELKKSGNERKCCPLCDRNMNNQELRVFERKIDEEVAKSSQENIQDLERELTEWEHVWKQLQSASQKATTRDRLKNTDIPALERQIKEKEGELSGARIVGEEATQRVNDAAKEMNELNELKRSATSISEIQRELATLRLDVDRLETTLLASGSTKTVEEVQAQAELLKVKIDGIDQELRSFAAEKELQSSALTERKEELHELEKKQANLKGKLREKTSLEDRIKSMKEDVESAANTIRELDAKVSDLDPVIEQLEQEHQAADQKLSEKLALARSAAQDVDSSINTLDDLTHTIEQYVQDECARHLKECSTEIRELDSQIAELERKQAEADEEASSILKGINESTAALPNLHNNLRARQLVNDIANMQAEINKYDMKEAVQAMHLFDEKYPSEKDEETGLQNTVAYLDGVIATNNQELESLQIKLQENYNDINRRYRDKLIKVKLSGMANNDLEKYAKALDSAIMKYHSLKMEEVNDTMRHLWNKTYQGTDIDGIKICSDSDTTGKRRSHQYRVVMTKDQAGMDMRGRCSAGQKMLASIIIRLALADSFGQNCGILALDEPTNALDTENIAALASSLADIINERKHHANFQLISNVLDQQHWRPLECTRSNDELYQRGKLSAHG
ncbi:uncharacterized protein PHACADRAFT_208087 [Phanerochaete carnosa HHB-10118-sp]|uniref:DNA repair protein RAD50 n=1 Tax=Phanerochaete carnosa (strain HHB-10118-sp) TaxID=650164 RepID=K5WD38_PHACS|nr:uncharacterized protein PHACADRAFT_208087 [Phanerochaete carnosa HHB-10118-sp]EKM56919.1 hypothetical protein PHACADRAFT_208087 [Phanerochaete carnosa HHB-10118-sp]